LVASQLRAISLCYVFLKTFAQGKEHKHQGRQAATQRSRADALIVLMKLSISKSREI